VRSSKTLVESVSIIQERNRNQKSRNAPNPSNMRIPFEDRDLQPGFPEMDSRGHATDTGADDADGLDLEALTVLHLVSYSVVYSEVVSLCGCCAVSIRQRS
jgi:hypothetical protein